MDNTGVTPAELRNIGLFGALSDEVLVVLSGMLTVVRPQIGEVIFREGDEANAMYVVLGGEMEVTKASRSGSTSSRQRCRPSSHHRGGSSPAPG